MASGFQNLLRCEAEDAFEQKEIALLKVGDVLGAARVLKLPLLYSGHEVGYFVIVSPLVPRAVRGEHSCREGAKDVGGELVGEKRASLGTELLKGNSVHEMEEEEQYLRLRAVPLPRLVRAGEVRLQRLAHPDGGFEDWLRQFGHPLNLGENRSRLLDGFALGLVSEETPKERHAIPDSDFRGQLATSATASSVRLIGMPPPR